METEHFHNISIRLTTDDKSPVSEELRSKCFYFQFASQYELDTVVAPAEPTLKRDSSLGELWHDVAPDDGGFRFDLAAQLPYFLPEFGGKPDYSIEIGDTQLFVSTRMVRCFHGDGDATTRLHYWLIHRLALQHLLEQTGIRQLHPIPMGTLIAKSFHVKAKSAQSAIQDNFYLWVRRMANEVSRFIEALKAANPKKCRRLPPVVTTSSFAMCYLVVTGANGVRGFQQFAPDPEQFAFRSLINIQDEECQMVQDLLNSAQSIPSEVNAIALARSFLHQGYEDLALVQTCVALESVLARQYRAFLLSRGVSNERYKDAQRDISLSNLLNLHLATFIDLQALEKSSELLGQLNWARRCRNEIVHAGNTARSVSAGEVERAIDAACLLIGHIQLHLN